VAEAGRQVRGQGDNLGHARLINHCRDAHHSAELLSLVDVILDVDLRAVAGVEPGPLPTFVLVAMSCGSGAQAGSLVRWSVCGSGVQRRIAHDDP
jgi:hypothetical protein